jgi:hypothetical protein
MSGTPEWKTGDQVTIVYHEIMISGLVELASPNHKSLVLSFNGIIEGHVGTMPVLWDGSGYRAIIGNHIITLSVR